MRVICSWCGRDMGTKEGKGITHGICKDCIKKIEKDARAGGHKNTKRSHDNTIEIN